jgi:hypothetical protein
VSFLAPLFSRSVGTSTITWSAKCREHSAKFREHSVKFREHSAKFREHSCRSWRPSSPAPPAHPLSPGQPSVGNIQPSLGNIQPSLGNIQPSIGNIRVVLGAPLLPPAHPQSPEGRGQTGGGSIQDRIKTGGTFAETVSHSEMVYDEDKKSVWPALAVGCGRPLQGCETYAHQPRMFSHNSPSLRSRDILVNKGRKHPGVSHSEVVGE